MNLPLEYSKLSAYFDPPGEDKNAIQTNRIVEKVLRKYKVGSVLDFTCGTGSQVFWLAKRGYEVAGVDFSPRLLAIAKRKAQKEGIDISLIKGDMRTTKVGRYDAVITIWNAIGHLTKRDFEKTMLNIHKNLKDGGLYVFDIINLNSMTNRVVANLAMDETKTFGTTQFHHIQLPKLDRKKGLLWAYDTFSIKQGPKKPRQFKGKFALQIYCAKELREMLSRNGFSVLGQYGMDGLKFLEKKTLRILTVARKRPT